MEACNATLGPFGMCQLERGHEGDHTASPPYTDPAVTAYGRRLLDEIEFLELRLEANGAPRTFARSF